MSRAPSRIWTILQQIITEDYNNDLNVELVCMLGRQEDQRVGGSFRMNATMGRCLLDFGIAQYGENLW